MLENIMSSNSSEAATSTKILIADDDLSTRMLLKAAIQQWGYEVIEVADGAEAWKVLNAESPPTLLIIDWLMPNMDGLELSSRVKNKLPFDCYIILLTQVNGNLNVVRALEAGADEFLTKPFNMGELQIRLSAGVKILNYKNTILIQHRLLGLCFLSMLLNSQQKISSELMLDHFDMNRLYDIYGDDYESINNFIKTYVNSALLLTNEIKHAIEVKDFDSAKLLIHKMKGSSGNSGAISIYDLSKKLENSIHENKSDESNTLLEEIKAILMKYNHEKITIDTTNSDFKNLANQQTILIVDDNLINLKLTQVVLKNSGFNVFTAINANEAMLILNQQHPSLIIMDLQIPGTNGLELTRIIKSNPKTRNIIIVALTANAMKGDKETALSYGCDAYITKPFDTKMLPKTISDLLDHKQL